MSKRGPRKIKVPVRNSIDTGTYPTTSASEPFSESLDKDLFISKEPTTAEPLSTDVVGQKEESPLKGRTWPDTILSVISGDTPLKTNRMFAFVIAAWVILVAWLFIQDNSANKLDNWAGLYWFLNKFLFITLFAVLVLILITIFSVFESKPSRKIKK